ncbi:TonB-dependent receptor [Prosthecochloris aestuarii DSM 271]|uniref:TonB-dependent receptor n=1 Tax=Prosthecochloris aestuarii (strain DSM 271 / SK 413) TaxID=290512 RepID=B4S8B6_PROA2|nr:TonB-dependent receptor [Prosthecochloris aestuarii]ACF46303.1 TonB-dependent receptor [Prosthecochloris aestuarii DSM 271]
MSVLLSVLFLAFLLAVAPSGLSAQQKDEKLVITAEEIRTMNVQKIDDLLNRIPGVKAGDSSVSIRGSSNVKVMLDGRSINDPTSHSGSVKWSMISLEAIERIVVIKGGGSTSYGDNTGGGVIVITSRRSDHFRGTAGGYLGNHGQQKATLDVQGGTERLSAGFSAGYENSDGFTLNDDKRRRRMGARAEYRFSDDFSLFLSGDYNDEHKGLRGYPERRTPNSRKEYDDVSLLFGQDVGAVSGKTWYCVARTLSTDPDRELSASLEVTRAGQSVEGPLSLPLAGNVDSGIGYEWQEASGSSVGKADEEQAWVFMSKTMQLGNGPWFVTAGARGNIYSEYSAAVNPEMKARYRTSKLSVELAYSRASNLPAFRKRFYESSVTKPNPDLQMEKATNYALSLSVVPDSSLSFDASLFYRDIKDRITYVRDLETNTGRYENFGEVTYKGVEVSASWSPSSLFEFTPSYSYLHALNEETGFWLPAKPFHTIMADVVFRPLDGWSFRAVVKYNGKTYVDSQNTRTLAAYTVVDARADYSLGDLTLYCDIDNLLDENYFYVDGYDAPPREWVVGMNYNF